MNDINYAGKQLRVYSVSEHCHDDWELIYYTSGSGELIFNTETIEYKKGDVVIIPPHFNHLNKSENGFTNINIRMSNMTVPLRGVKKLADNVLEQFYHTFSDIDYYFNSDIKNKEIILSSLGSLISSYIIVYTEKNTISHVVENIRNSIIKNFADINYKLDDYMKTLPFSYDYLRKLYKKETGMTPHDFLIKTRMNAAEMLLSGTTKFDYSISEASELCGFSEPLYFSRVFKAYFGCSPKEYTLKIKNNKD